MVWCNKMHYNFSLLGIIKKDNRGCKNEKNNLFKFGYFNAFGTYRMRREQKVDPWGLFYRWWWQFTNHNLRWRWVCLCQRGRRTCIWRRISHSDRTTQFSRSGYIYHESKSPRRLDIYEMDQKRWRLFNRRANHNWIYGRCWIYRCIWVMCKICNNRICSR